MTRGTLLYSLTSLCRSVPARELVVTILSKIEKDVNQQLTEQPEARFIGFMLNAYANAGGKGEGINKPLLWAQVWVPLPGRCVVRSAPASFMHASLPAVARVLQDDRSKQDCVHDADDFQPAAACWLGRS